MGLSNILYKHHPETGQKADVLSDEEIKRFNYRELRHVLKHLNIAKKNGGVYWVDNGGFGRVELDNYKFVADAIGLKLEIKE